MPKLPKCDRCGSIYTYEDRSMYVCPECEHQWEIGSDEKNNSEKSVINDAFGNVIQDGDNVTIIKNLKIKGTSSPLKAGTKVKNIRIVDEVDGHSIEAKIPGFGVIMLKSEVIKKSK